VGVFHEFLLAFDGGNPDADFTEAYGVVLGRGVSGCGPIRLDFLQDTWDLNLGGPFPLQRRRNRGFHGGGGVHV
jgi:hypothetical protein